MSMKVPESYRVQGICKSYTANTLSPFKSLADSLIHLLINLKVGSGTDPIVLTGLQTIAMGIVELYRNYAG